MTITLHLPPEVESNVQYEAERRSVPVETYLTNLLLDAMPHHGEADRRERSLSLLRSLRDIGDENEQRETFEYLKEAVDRDRTSTRKRFA